MSLGEGTFFCQYILPPQKWQMRGKYAKYLNWLLGNSNQVIQRVVYQYFQTNVNRHFLKLVLLVAEIDIEFVPF